MTRLGLPRLDVAVASESSASPTQAELGARAGRVTRHVCTNIASSQFGVDVQSVLCFAILQRKSVAFLSLVAAASAFQAGTFFAPVGAAGKRCGDPSIGLSPNICVFVIG